MIKPEMKDGKCIGFLVTADEIEAVERFAVTGLVEPQTMRMIAIYCTSQVNGLTINVLSEAEICST